MQCKVAKLLELRRIFKDELVTFKYYHQKEKEEKRELLNYALTRVVIGKGHIYLDLVFVNRYIS